MSSKNNKGQKNTETPETSKNNKNSSFRLKKYFSEESQKRRSYGADEWFKKRRRPFGW